jgi:hypothetical protein
LRFICLPTLQEKSDQQPGAAPVLAADLASRAVAPSGKVPVTGQGGVPPIEGAAPIVGGALGNPGISGGTDSVVVGSAGLSPALPNSVAPSGMPARPVLKAGGVGSGGGVGLPTAAPAQLPIAGPARPPPSNRLVVGVVAALPPTPRQAGLGGGLTPGVASSVALNGMPAGPTLMPGAAGAGEAAPSGAVFTSPTCAEAKLPLRKEIAKAAATMCLFMVRPLTSGNPTSGDRIEVDLDRSGPAVHRMQVVCANTFV